MTDFREEAYIIESKCFRSLFTTFSEMEITEDAEDDEYEYDEVKESDEEKIPGAPESDEDDLNNFDLLKAKTTMKQAMQTKGKF